MVVRMGAEVRHDYVLEHGRVLRSAQVDLAECRDFPRDGEKGGFKQAWGEDLLYPVAFLVPSLPHQVLV